MSYHKHLKGNDLHAPSQELVENNTGATLSKLKVVTLNGMGTVFPQIKLNNSTIDSPFGIVNTDIITGKSGMITCLGFMYEVDTSSWIAGTSLYSDALGNLTPVVSGNTMAIVTKQDDTYGIMYVFSLVNFIKTNFTWSTLGNADIDVSSNFLGTTDSNPLKIKTNNEDTAQFNDGKFGIGPDAPLAPFHLKPYTGYSKSGLRIDSFVATTNDILFNDIYSLTVANNSVVKITFDVTSRQNDGFERSSFTRSALFYKENDDVLIQGLTWQSDFTIKSNSAFDIQYVLSSNTVDFKVKAANSTDTYWVGNIKIEVLQTNI